ncbi:MAG: Gfo/Idh/MocA family oxidoreductase [Prolixibacteraceae bacterium]|nr:Gfo/Idh/MocA family oxidoreductase [Prolixibacteraceae bacterium]
MSARRDFLKTTGKTVAAVTIAPGLLTHSAFTGQPEKKITIGIIGAENSHSYGYGRMFNTDKKFPGVEVKYIWGETDEFAKVAMERGNIPYQVKDPAEMMGKIDALIVDHRHPKYHLEPAIPFVKAGIPTFIDKPFCYRVSEGEKFLELARSVGTPVSSWSTAAYNDVTMDLKKQVEKLEKINNLVVFGPADIESQWGGIFFYGVHMIEQILTLFGDNVEKVRVSKNGNTATGTLVFNNGMLATLVFLTQARDRLIYAETNKKVIEIKSDVKETDPPKAYVDMVEMFRTGKEPKSHDRILYGIAVLEALEKSVKKDKWVKVKI